MRLFSKVRGSEHTMKRNLFGYMLVMAAVLLVTVFTALFLLGRFSSTEKQLRESLDLQMEVFSSQLQSESDELAGISLALSREMSDRLELFLAEEELTFARLTDSPELLEKLQDSLIVPLGQYAVQADCSGAFLMLDTTVNTHSPHADFSRSGLYLQRRDIMSASRDLLLYRGSSRIGKQHGFMPHRKWRLEFRTDLFPEYDDFLRKFSPDRRSDYRYTDVLQLPGTSEKAVLLTVPMYGTDGSFYGLAGMEISQSYFQHKMAQPAGLDHLTCLISSYENDRLDADGCFSCGGTDGYYLAPRGQLEPRLSGSSLYRLTGGAVPYIGAVRDITLSPFNRSYTLAAMIPLADYRREAVRGIVQTVLLVLLILFFTVSCCIYFTRRFLSPVLRGLEQLKSEHRAGMQSGFQEIDDLFGFLARQDQAHETALTALREEKQDAQFRAALAQQEYERVQNSYRTAQSEIARLAYDRTQEVDPDQYRLFLSGIQNLTPTEREIFGYYLEGRSVQEILSIAGIKESTLRYHNRNIYSKLGVNSLKQLLRYAALMSWQEQEDGAQ